MGSADPNGTHPRSKIEIAGRWRDAEGGSEQARHADVGEHVRVPSAGGGPEAEARRPDGDRPGRGSDMRELRQCARLRDGGGKEIKEIKKVLKKK